MPTTPMRRPGRCLWSRGGPSMIVVVTSLLCLVLLPVPMSGAQWLPPGKERLPSYVGLDACRHVTTASPNPPT